MTARDNLLKFGAYAKALELFDLVVADMALLSGKRECERLVAQQIAGADSVASNIEEGYGRGSKREYAQFLVVTRGSAQETAGRYQRLSHWLPNEIIAARIALCDEIIGILSATIKRLRTQLATS